MTHTLHDGEDVTLGGVTLTAHLTPGHTRGCTTWTMQTHSPGDPPGQLRNVVIVGSWSVLSEYRLIAEGNQQPSYPGIAMNYTMTFSVLHALPCDIFLASHGQLFDMLGKLQRVPKEGARVWIDPGGYRQAVQSGQSAFETAFTRQAKDADRKAKAKN